MHKLILSLSLSLAALPAAATEGIVPSKPGGAMYLPCKLAAAALKAAAGQPNSNSQPAQAS